MKIRKGYCTKIVAVCITALAIAAITGSFSRLPAQESKGENPGVISLGSALSRVDESNQYALIVGINLYDKIGNLNNAVLDAKELKRILVNRYRYAEENIIQLYDRDATQVNIESALRDQVKKLTPVDNLLVYFSGHGHLDRTFGMGFWLPSNIGSDLPKDAVYASEEELINASSLKISNSIIQGMMKNCRAHHIFVVADACFAGHLLVEKGYKNSGDARPTPSLEYYKKPSRQVFASGRERVSDGKPGEHSPFAKFFLKYLKNNTSEYMTAFQIIADVMASVPHNADQIPIGGPAKNVGDENGQFFFPFKYHRQMNRLKAGYASLLAELDKPEIKRNIKIEKCGMFVESLKSFPDSFTLEQMKANIQKKSRKLKNENRKIAQMRDGYKRLNERLEGKNESALQKLTWCREFLKDYGKAPADAVVSGFKSKIMEKIGALKLDVFAEEFQALEKYHKDPGHPPGKKLKKWQDFRGKVTEILASKTGMALLEGTDERIGELKKQLQDEYDRHERIASDPSKSVKKRIAACRTFLAANEGALEDGMVQKLKAQILDLEKSDKKKQVRQVQQEETAYRSLQSGISLEGYLDYVERYPGSVRAGRLKEQLIKNYPTLAPEKYWKEIKLNDKNYWEKEFENSHVMIWIPSSKAWVDKYEVSNRQWRTYSGDTVKKINTVTLGNMENYIRDFPDYPVIVTLEEALDYCNTYGLRLLSEAEWETAAGRGKGNRFPWGNEPVRWGSKFRANLESFADGFVFTAPVTAFSEYKSPYGQVNMAGNAAEWIGVSGKGRRTERRLKGGGYLSKESALKVKAAEPAEPGDTGGFRCIREETGEDIK